jgi:hypothetical protein
MTAEPLAVQVFTERDNKDECLHFLVVFALAVLLSLHKYCQMVMLTSENFLYVGSSGENFKSKTAGPLLS